MPETITDVVCSFCGCLCDDVEVIVNEGRIEDTMNACKISHEKFVEIGIEENRIRKSLIRENGEATPTTLERAVDKAAEILMGSDFPLLYGWSSTTCEASKVGMEIAEEVGGAIDNTASVCHGPSILAEQGVGYSGCTLGEVKNYADLIIYWGSNPEHAHPRHLSRYTMYPRGFYMDRGVRDRKLVVVDIRKTDTAKLADKFVQVKPNWDYELLSSIRVLLRGGKIPEEVAGVPSEEIEDLTEMMKGCNFGVLFFGLGLTMSRGKYMNVTSAIQLVTDLNDHTKFIIMPMRGHYNVTGANTVSTWETGFPYAVDFARGYPRYAPGESSIVDLLRDGTVDSAMIVASDPASALPRKAVENLLNIPVITLDPHKSPTTEISDVVIPTAVAGIEASGTAYRMDHVPIRLRKFVDPPPGIVSDEEVLRMIRSKIKGAE